VSQNKRKKALRGPTFSSLAYKIPEKVEYEENGDGDREEECIKKFRMDSKISLVECGILADKSSLKYDEFPSFSTTKRHKGKD